MVKPLHYYRDRAEAPNWLREADRKLSEADAVVVLSAEYNRCIPPALSNLLDHFPGSSFSYKPSAIVCYSMGNVILIICCATISLLICVDYIKVCTLTSGSTVMSLGGTHMKFSSGISPLHHFSTGASMCSKQSSVRQFSHLSSNCFMNGFHTSAWCVACLDTAHHSYPFCSFFQGANAWFPPFCCCFAILLL